MIVGDKYKITHPDSPLIGQFPFLREGSIIEITNIEYDENVDTQIITLVYKDAVGTIIEEFDVPVGIFDESLGKMLKIKKNSKNSNHQGGRRRKHRKTRHRKMKRSKTTKRKVRR